ncbi:WXG100 family type VII secretion target [Dactylosporangium sp. AC04546]|uniref:WXG100 family type VII secretion target n=1 Tax=Dactylosporangium sp. AC04546 TaxID=2862460 RepID=UPI001EE05374|nr:WXG100 family type VII secretion target [Dactylosporangium sp. AC04546]WVK81436.1 WXG100 family type VII secretion target [Dactylosporangium sp. AC04546]
MTQPMRVDSATMHAAAKDVRSTHDTVNGKLSDLRNQIDDLVAAWKGQASAGFESVMRRWDGDTNKLLKALSDIADLLDKGANTHQANEEEQAAMMNKYNTSLNY